MRNILNYLVILLSLTTATGVLLHDARIDKAAWTSLSQKRVPSARVASVRADAGIAVDSHTHPQHSGQTLHGFSYRAPSHPPRDQRMKKYLHQVQEPNGRHAFDHSYMPVVS